MTIVRRFDNDRGRSGSQASAVFPEHALQKSLVYQTLCGEKMEIDRHKWLESEKAGHDVGFDRALFGWLRLHRKGWLLHSERTRA